MLHLLRPHYCFMLIAPAALLACAWGGSEHQSRLERHGRLEQAFVLMDESEMLDADGSRRLALERLNRSAHIYESPKVFFMLGRQFEAAGKTDEAATAYLQALRLAPDYQEAYFSLLALGYESPDLSPSPEDVAEANRWAAAHPVAPITATPDAEALELADAGLSPEELAALREQLLQEAADRRRPTLSEVKAVIFARQDQQADLPSALDPTYRNDEDIILGTHNYHYNKADQLRRRGEYEKAAQEYAQALAIDPSQLQTRLDIGDMMLKLERDTRALYHYEKARADFPESARPMLKLGNYYMSKRDHERARECYRAAQDIDPLNMKVFNNLSVLAMREKDYDAAIALLDNMIELDPAYANAYYNRGILAEDIERDDAMALKMYETYLELDGPQSAQVREYIEAIKARQ